jgi:uncharacterized membrane protein (TIGR02234 family)
MTSRRGLLIALALCLLGASVVLVAAGRSWVTAAGAVDLAAGLGVRLTGRTVAAAVPALGLVALGGTVAMVAARGRLRVLVGALLTLVGGWTSWLALRIIADPDAAARSADGVGAVAAGSADVTGWAWAAAVGGLLVAAAGLLAAVRGPGWPAMSARYDRPTLAQRAGVPPEVQIWEALDRGDDPTR